MSRSVRHEADQVGIFPFLSRFFFVEYPAYGLYDFQIVPLVVSSDVVGLSRFSSVVYQVYCLAVVQYVEPVPYVLAVSIDGDRFFRKAFPDDGRDQFFVMLFGSVVVGAIRGSDVHAIGVVVCPDDEVGAGFAGGVRTVRRIGGRFGEVSGFSQCSIDFICGDVVKAAIFISCTILSWRYHPVPACVFDEVEGSHHICFHKGFRSLDGVVDMAFGREVDDAPDIVLSE